MERLTKRRSLPPPALRRAIRQAAGPSQAEVAQECGVSQRTVSRWECGVANPRGEHLSRYVALLNELQVPR